MELANHGKCRRPAPTSPPPGASLCSPLRLVHHPPRLPPKTPLRIAGGCPFSPTPSSDRVGILECVSMPGRVSTRSTPSTPARFLSRPQMNARAPGAVVPPPREVPQRPPPALSLVPSPSHHFRCVTRAYPPSLHFMKAGPGPAPTQGRRPHIAHW